MSDISESSPIREVPVSWEALEDAFENNAPDVHSYLSLADGDVRRIVDGVADPVMHRRLVNDANFLCVEPVSSREQYRWMERFIVTLEADDARERLTRAIDGKGAFRRFKDALMSYPEDRERWFTFRSGRLRVAMESWLEAHRVKPITRPEWREPDTAEEPLNQERAEGEPASEEANDDALAARRKRVAEMLGPFSARELDMVATFVEFLHDRRMKRRGPSKRPGSAPKRRVVPEEPAA